MMTECAITNLCEWILIAPNFTTHLQWQRQKPLANPVPLAIFQPDSGLTNRQDITECSAWFMEPPLMSRQLQGRIAEPICQNNRIVGTACLDN